MRAAEEAGLEDGYAMLADGEVREELRRMRETAAAELRREDVLRRLGQIAFGAGGAEALLAPEGDPGELELGAVAELRRNSAGSVEIKFIDRVRALSALYELLGSSDDGAGDFFRALEEAGE